MEFIIIIMLGCIAVSIFNALGSISSRLLKFKYAWLMIGSLVIYGSVAFYTATYNGIVAGVIASAIVGMFDATVGMLISKKLKATIPERDTIHMDITLKLVISMGVLAGIIGFITILFLN